MIRPPKLSVGRGNIQVFQTPTKDPKLDPEPALWGLISRAKTEVAFAIYSFTLQSVADALLSCRAAGVPIFGVADRGQASNPKSQIPVLVQAGVDVLVTGTQYNLMHIKVVVVDRKWVGMGSYNWTTGAEHSNAEMFVILTSTKLAEVARSQIVSVREKAKHL